MHVWAREGVEFPGRLSEGVGPGGNDLKGYGGGGGGGGAETEDQGGVRGIWGRGRKRGWGKVAPNHHRDRA